MMVNPKFNDNHREFEPIAVLNVSKVFILILMLASAHPIIRSRGAIKWNSDKSELQNRLRLSRPLTLLRKFKRTVFE